MFRHETEMSRHETLVENFADACFTLLMEEVAREEGEQLEQLSRGLLSDPEAGMPVDLDRRCRKAIDRRFAGQRRRGSLRTAGRVLQHTAAMAVAASLLLVSVCAVSDDARITTGNLIITVRDKYTEVQRIYEPIDNGRSFGRAVKQYFDSFDIGWLPDGFAYAYGEYGKWTVFKNDNGIWLSVSCAAGSAAMQVDTENADSVENIEINGNAGFLIIKNGQTQIFLYNSEFDLCVEVFTTNGISTETAKKIMENITVHDQYTYRLTPGADDTGEVCLDAITIGWLPDGFVQTHGDYKGWAGFQNKYRFWINISWLSGDGVLQVDTEDADSVENIAINGDLGLCVVKDGRTQIILFNAEHDYFIDVGTSAGIPTSITEKIAENITFH